MSVKVRFNATALARDGERVGTIKEIVLEPQTHDILSLVVKQGLLFEEDQLIPFELVDKADDEYIYLNASSDELWERSQVYNHQQYASLGARAKHENLSGKLWVRPMDSQISIIPPGIGPISPPADVPIPAEDIGLLHGSQVYDLNEKNVGSVKGLIATSLGTTTHLLLSEGVVFSMPKVVPLDWVTQLTDTQVVLSGDVAALEQLPDYEESSEAGETS